MNKVSISSLAWTILSTACISLDDVPLRPADGSDGGTDAAHDVALLSDGGMDDALVADAELDSQADSVGSRDAGTTLDGGTPVCNADGFCLVARFRPLSSIESDGHDVYLLDGPSTDMLGNRATDTRLWKVQSASTSVLADRIAVTDFQQLSGVSDGFVYWTQNRRDIPRVEQRWPSAAGLSCASLCFGRRAVGDPRRSARASQR